MKKPNENDPPPISISIPIPQSQETNFSRTARTGRIAPMLQQQQQNGGSQQQRPEPTPAAAQIPSSIPHHQFAATTTARIPPTPPPLPPLRSSSNKFFAILFITHLVGVTALVLFLIARAVVAASNGQFRPNSWYPPLLTAAPVSVVGAVGFLVGTLRYPEFVMRSGFWVSCAATLAASVFLLVNSTTLGDAFGAVAMVFAVLLSLHSCWVTPRIPHCSDVLFRSVNAVPASSAADAKGFVIATLLTAGAWSAFIAAGFSAAASQPLAVVYDLALIFSLAWFLSAARCSVYIGVARIAGSAISRAMDSAEPSSALRESVSSSFGSISLAALVGPTIGKFRGAARAIGRVAGDDEFLFSCAGCYQGAMERAHENANTWGLVYVAMRGQPYMVASRSTWMLMKRSNVSAVADLDLTSSMCFSAGITVGALAVFTSGAWSFAVNRDASPVVAVLSYVIGYLLTRVAMAWPEGCVGAYHVMYAEDPQNGYFDDTIPKRMGELRALPE